MGVVEKSEIIDGSKVKAGDVLIGIAASGVHSNGYSLVRKILAVSKADLKGTIAGKPMADVLMAPTRIYIKPLLSLIKTLPVHAMAHITGGGLPGNLPRVLPEGCDARIDLGRGLACGAEARAGDELANLADELQRRFVAGLALEHYLSELLRRHEALRG